MKQRLFLPLTGFLGFIGYCFYRGACARKAQHQVREEVTRWEGEGGNDPAVATPTPQVVPAASGPNAYHAAER